ncbi:MAG: hypothetical protein HYT90_05980, partial [Candidatus Omnitrophica bacterium]|nr:hypothetical protein [Candidatus Omnitrophota bacterium]
MTLRAGFLGLLSGLLLALAAGCGTRPSYPKAHLAESLQEILRGEQLDASVRFVDHTLGVQASAPSALAQLEGQITLGPTFDELTRKVLTAVHRVLLSSDADVRFYVLLLSDPQIPGAYLTIVRYMDDIRRANANMLDVPEMFARTIYDLNYGGAAPLTLDQYLPRDIQLEEFLSWQLARRIQTALTGELRASGDTEVGRCTGRFQEGEFVFMLDVHRAGAEGPLDDATLQQAFRTSTDVIAKVLSSYRFESFDSVRLIHPLTGRHLVLPKARL